MCTSNSFMVPDIVELITKLKDSKVVFKSQKEVQEVLITKMDEMHGECLDSQVDTLKNVDPEEFKHRKRQVYQLNFKKNPSIGCMVRGCRLRIVMIGVKDKKSGVLTYTFSGSVFDKRHNLPFH